MEVYVDVIILENFIIDLFLLMFTMHLTSRKYKSRNIVLSSLIGSFYSLVAVIPSLKFFSNTIFGIIISIIMVKIVYGKSKFINFFRVMSVYYIISFTLAGICILFSFNQNSYVIGDKYILGTYSLKYIIIGLCLIGIIFMRIKEYIKNSQFIDNYSFLIEFDFNNEKYLLQSFLDTGNEMRECITNLPCIVVEKEYFNINLEKYDTLLIPFSTISGESSLRGVRVDNIILKKKEENIKKFSAIICPCEKVFTFNNSYNALLPRGVL